MISRQPWVRALGLAALVLLGAGCGRWNPIYSQERRVLRSVTAFQIALHGMNQDRVHELLAADAEYYPFEHPEDQPPADPERFVGLVASLHTNDFLIHVKDVEKVGAVWVVRVRFQCRQDGSTAKINNFWDGSLHLVKGEDEWVIKAIHDTSKRSRFTS